MHEQYQCVRFPIFEATTGHWVNFYLCRQAICVQLLGKVEDIESKDGNMDAHIVLAHSDVKRARVKFSNFKFSPVRGWLTPEVHETIGGLQTTVCAHVIFAWCCL